MLLLAGLALLMLATLVPSAAAQDELPGDTDRPVVVTTSVEGVITPIVRDRLDTVIAEAEAASAEAVVITLDTPGGLLDATRTIVQRFLAAEVAVVVHVAPPGADAGSAGTFITTAAHVAAMAPATTIGAATPVDLEGGTVDDKIVENTVAFAEAIAEARDRNVDFLVDSVRDGRSITASRALEEDVIDVVADDLDDLLAALDGREVELASGPVTLRTADAVIAERDATRGQGFLQVLADPNLAFILLSLGSLAILYEIANPGLGLGGVIGVASLVLAFISLASLPVQTAGIILLIVAAVMFVAELFIPGIGVGAAGGTGALVLAGLLLFQGGTGVSVDWWVLAPTAAVTFGATALAGVFAARTRSIEPVRGSDDLIGHRGVVQDAALERPRIQVYGAYWRVRPADGRTLQDGDDVEVVDRDNLDLIVRPVDHDADTRPTT
ncbi:MAG: hypothetical protein JJT89_08330 [Nitriliruptoraceae bacterium]|nr:hypothetical protein [Nitriliruptoraceae bacterium]